MAPSSSRLAVLSRGFRTSTFRHRTKNSAIDEHHAPRTRQRRVLASRRTRTCRARGNRTMNWIANILVVLVALLHGYFLVLEMYLWTRPLGLKTFGQSLQKATDSAALAANQ